MTPTDDLSTLNFMRGFSTAAVVGIHWMGMTGHLPDSLRLLPRVVVLMFFVHTGCVLMSSLERQFAKSPNKLWRRFMFRRVFRVYPLSTFVIAAILLFSIPSHLIPPDFHFVRLDGSGILANFFLVMNLANYEPLLSPMWSLPYEFQLYLALPFIYRLASRRRGSAWVIGLFLLSLVLALLRPLVPHAGRLDILSFAPCFIAGILCYRLMTTVRPRLPFLLWTALLPAFMALSLLWPDSYPWPAIWTACVMTAIAMPFIEQSRSTIVCRVCRGLAEHSYAIYLSHYFCLWLAFRANRLQAPWQWLIFVATIIALPAVLYRAIELPMIRIGRRLSEGNTLFVPAAASGVRLRA